MSGLNFQDFNVDVVGSSSSPFTSTLSGDNNKQSATNSSQLSGQVGDGPTDGGAQPNGEGKPHFLSFGFYQRYFDVDTTQVQSRILHSFLPTRSVNFITDHVQPLPDLYGPFWICVTLVFSIAIFGNFAHFIQYASARAGDSYENDFGLVTSATTLIFCYVILVPFAIYSFMWHRKTMVQYSYMEMVCAYGYSLAIFVPVSVLWVVELQWFRWALIVISVAASGVVLFGTFWPVVSSEPNRLVALGFIAGVLALHALLAVGFKEFYFDTSMPAYPRIPDVAPTAEKLSVIATTLSSTTQAVGLNGNKSRRAVTVHASSPIVLVPHANTNDTIFSSIVNEPTSNSSHPIAIPLSTNTNDTTIIDQHISDNDNKIDDQKDFPAGKQLKPLDSQAVHEPVSNSNSTVLMAVDPLSSSNSITTTTVPSPSLPADETAKNATLSNSS